VALGRVSLPPGRLSGERLARLRDAFGTAAVRDDRHARVLHAAGKGYPDLVRLRAGEPGEAPDAIIYPAGAAELRRVLALCAEESIAVVPFGGGTSVVGGVAPMAGEHRSVIALDTSRMRELLHTDALSSTVTVQGGMRAPELERRLAPRGLTLGHYPQSFEYVSLGGCAATRSAGQSSTGYGAIAEMILGLSLYAPARQIDLPPLPATAAGPGLRQLIIGSEGALGVIGELSLRVRRTPAERVYEGAFFREFDSGVEALRELAGEHRSLPDVVRLSDEPETRMSLSLAGAGGLKRRAGSALLAARGYGGGCLAILGFEGTSEDVAVRRRHALGLIRGLGGVAVGRSPGAAWQHSRFAGPYLRDDLLTQGVIVETLETAVQWSGLHALHRAVGEAISGALGRWGTPALVMCHISHVYETGASLYFTFLARQHADDPIGQWRAAKTAATDAIAAGGGTITHHHSVGRDHAPWMAREVGEGGLAVLRAAKDELDPTGIMNPGKLFPS